MTAIQTEVYIYMRAFVVCMCVRISIGIYTMNFSDSNTMNFSNEFFNRHIYNEFFSCQGLFLLFFSIPGLFQPYSQCSHRSQEYSPSLPGLSTLQFPPLRVRWEGPYVYWGTQARVLDFFEVLSQFRWTLRLVFYHMFSHICDAVCLSSK